jgi:hypothetical protein
MMPGSRTLGWLSEWFDPHVVSSVFEPLIADWQREWEGARGFARARVRIQGAAALFVAIITASPNVLLTPSPAGTVRRVVTRLTMGTGALTAITVFPFIGDLASRLDTDGALYVLILLLPQAIAVAFPMAMATTVDLIRTAAKPTREERIVAVRIAIAACALLLILDGWVFPAANQQYRVAITQAAMGDAYKRAPAKGKNELSLTELTRDWFEPRAGDSVNAEYAMRELNRRAGMILMPVFFVWARWRALRLPRGRWYSPAPLIVSAPLLIVCSYALFTQNQVLADVLWVPRWSGVWVGFAIMVVSAIVVDRVRQRAAGTDNSMIAMGGE